MHMTPSPREGGAFCSTTMIEIAKDRQLAPKTFFVAPDPIIVSETFLETAFLMGYESYALPHELTGSDAEKLEATIELFDQTLLFFTLDRKRSLSSCASHVSELQQQYGRRVRIGVLYDKPEQAETEEAIKRTFGIEIGATAGCVPLDYSARKSRLLLLNLLSANHANGRRKVIRMKCPPTFTFNILAGEIKIEGVLIDLSTSHFSGHFVSQELDLQVGTKVHNVQLILAGILLLVNLLVALKRAEGGKTVYVFLFHAEQKGSGTDDFLKSKINKLIFHHFQVNTLNKIHAHMDGRKYHTATQINEDSRRTASP